MSSKEAVLTHIVEKQALGARIKGEHHSESLSASSSAAIDAAKEISLLLLLLFFLLSSFQGNESLLPLLALFSIGFTIWRAGRVAFVSWARLERLHRVLEQERFEIDHHREEEREELRALYGAKGFEGELLNKVVDVLMADDERLLKVMVEEELNLVLESEEHPLNSAMAALFGSTVTAAALLLTLYFLGHLFFLAFSPLLIALFSYRSAILEENEGMPAAVWNLALALLAALSCHFIQNFLNGG